MTVTRRPAGEARERPRPAASAEKQSSAGGVMRKNVGAAPVFDAGAKQLRAAAKPASETPTRGMISNPWVKHWSGQAPPPTLPAQTAAPPARPQKKAAGAHQRSAGESHGRGKGTK
ncbi:MAG: hypothetical protein JO288_03250 [Hyphomicrobiales bacterium]|nr:hypothetical protein [Hyphomicrobiales bacterium]